MSEWDDRFKNYPVHVALSNLQDILDSDDLVSEDITVIGLIDRVFQAVEYTSVSLDSVIPVICNN